MTTATKRQPKFKRRQYKMNWREILNTFEAAHKALIDQGIYSSYLADGITALRERLGMPEKRVGP